LLLIFAALLPAVAVAGIVLTLYHRQTTRIVESGLLETSRALSLAIDAEIHATVSALEILSQDPALAAGDFHVFRAQAQRARQTMPSWRNVILQEPWTDRQFINLRTPEGPAVTARTPAHAVDVARRGIARATDLFVGPVSKESIVDVSVPVRIAGRVQYVLRMPSSSPPRRSTRSTRSRTR
jgi:hypothetical protein